MKPPICFTVPYTIARPSPVPLPAGFVVKNGWKICALVASSMPWPVSLTTNTAYRPFDIVGCCRRVLVGELDNRMCRSSGARRSAWRRSR